MVLAAFWVIPTNGLGPEFMQMESEHITLVNTSMPKMREVALGDIFTVIGRKTVSMVMTSRHPHRRHIHTLIERYAFISCNGKTYLCNCEQLRYCVKDVTDI